MWNQIHSDEALHESVGCRFLLTWFDDTPREEMRRELIPEVQRTLEGRMVLPNSELLKLAEKYPPPQEWLESKEECPFDLEGENK